MSTVTVGCKLPNGLHMDLGDKRVTLNGLHSARMIGGHGITENVDKSFFDAWVAKNAHLEFVKLGHVFAHEKTLNAEAHAKAREMIPTGFEGKSASDIKGLTVAGG